MATKANSNGVKSNTLHSFQYDCVVIGGGPAGYTSAFYLNRFGRSVALVQHGVPRARWIPKIHHLIGHEKNLGGRRLLKRMRDHACQLKIPVYRGEAKVSRERKGFRIQFGRKSITAARVILATGILDHEPDFPETMALKRKGYLRYCPICDGHDFKGAPLAVLVRDAAGIQEAEFIAKYTPDLHVILLKKIALLPNHRDILEQCGIRLHHKKVHSIQVATKPKGIVFHFSGGKKLHVRAAYVALGKVPKDSAYGHLRVRRTQDGFLKVNSTHRTSIPGLYAVGDCVNDLYQISVAAAHGAIAATDVHNSLFA